MLEIVFAPAALPRTGTLVLPVAQNALGFAELGGLAPAADEASGGALSRALAAAAFTAGHGQTCQVFAPGGFDRILLLGLGKTDALTPRLAEEAAGAAIAALKPVVAQAALDASALPAGIAAALALGATLRLYRFDRYRTREKPEDKKTLATLTLLVADPAAAQAAWGRAQAIARGVFLTRDLVTEPPNILTPTEMAERCRPLAELGLEVEIYGPKDLAALGFGAMLGVAQGSVQEPRMVVLQWKGASGPDAKLVNPAAFIGKGVTFDTGGISIKGAAGMEDMKWDMAGAGTVVGLMAALAGRRAKLDAVGLVGLVENMPSGSAQRPSDVVASHSGQTIEVLNTDAEGRLVLADVLWYAQSRFAPRFMIDLATLTGAMIVALGHEQAGMFSNDDTLAANLADAATVSGEALWRMPLGEAYDKQLRSEIADMKNITGRPGSSITAAQFLQRFTNGAKWAHLDIAGVAWSGKDQPCIPKGATAWGVRLLDTLVARHCEPGA